MDTGVVNDLVLIFRLDLPFSLYFSLLFRKIAFGDGFESDCVVRQRLIDSNGRLRRCPNLEITFFAASAVVE
jgi:hypothetical protein